MKARFFALYTVFYLDNGTSFIYNTKATIQGCGQG